MARKKKKNKLASKKWVKYKVQGSSLTKSKSCPKCGPGIFLAEHKDRLFCGMCHYVEVKGK